MITSIFEFLDLILVWLWSYIGFAMIIFVGAYMLVRSRGAQVVKFFKVVRIFYELLTKQAKEGPGIHPIQAFFAAVGGCIGIGNLVGVCVAVQLGGPGAIFWIWMAGLLGSLIKYSEVFLGMKYRIKNQFSGFDGGPMYYLRKAFSNRYISVIATLLLCVYGVEIYMFKTITDSVVSNWHIHPYLAIFILLILVLLGSTGGIKRVGKISSSVIPVFLVIFVFMGIWVIMANRAALPGLLATIFKSAFTGYAPVGAFLGSSFMLTVAQGLRLGCYSGDVGIGYASVIHAESREVIPSKQAALAIFAIFLDTFVICTITLLLISITGTWQEPIPDALQVQRALETYFPGMHIFMPVFLCLLGYSTIIAFFSVGLKCATFLAPKMGKPIYIAYAIIAFLLFSFIESVQAMIVMGIAGGVLLLINVTAFFRMRKEISFDF